MEFGVPLQYMTQKEIEPIWSIWISFLVAKKKVAETLLSFVILVLFSIIFKLLAILFEPCSQRKLPESEILLASSK